MSQCLPREQTVQKWLKAISLCYAVSEKSTEKLREMMISNFDANKCPDKPPPAYLCKDHRDFQTKGFELKDCQRRYLVTMCDCNKVERLRQNSIEYVKNCEWVRAADQLCAATNELDTLIHVRDAWWAVMLLVQEDPTTPVADDHAIPVVEMLYRNIEILRIDTANAYETALRRVESRMKTVNSKLAPMLHNRDLVRASIGEVRWTENRQPKNDFANRRNTLETERKCLLNALGILYDLHVVSFE